MQGNQSVLEAKMSQFAEHLQVDRGMSATTARTRRNLVRYFLRKWGTLTPTVELVESAKREQLLGGKHAGYVGNMILSMRDYAKWIGVDLAKVAMPKRAKPRLPKYLTMHEVQGFLFVIDSVRDRALFSLLAYSGLRCSELLNLRLEDVDLNERTVRVIGGKGGKSMTVALGEGAVEPVRAYIALRPATISPWLFYAQQERRDIGHKVGDKLSTNRVRVLARLYGSRAAIPKKVSPHMFRHALATHLLERGCPLPFVQRQLRHARIETTMQYLHLSDVAYRQNFDRFVPRYG
jgi:site-specific recombinase XerD